MIGSRRITLQFSVNWLVGIWAVALILIGAFIFGYDAWRPTLIFTAVVLGGTGAVIAAANALDSRAPRVQQAKIAVSLDLIYRWNDPNFLDAKKKGRDFLGGLGKQVAVEEQNKYIQEEQILLGNLLEVLNFFEVLSAAIQAGIADEEFAKRFFSHIVSRWWYASEAYIKLRRAERQNLQIFEELEWLFKKWGT